MTTSAFPECGKALELLQAIVSSSFEINEEKVGKKVEEMLEEEENFSSFVRLLKAYQESPHYIDSGLSSMVNLLVNDIQAYVMEKEEGLEFPTKRILKFHLCCKALTIIMQVRGFKIICKFFSHELFYILPLLNLLEFICKNQADLLSQCWETKYVLLLWLVL